MYSDTSLVYVINLIPGSKKTYFSNDKISQAADQISEYELLYPTEFLNSLKFSSIPDHELNLKVGCEIMLLRNINQNSGLCNDTRLIITQLASNVIEGKVISGTRTPMINFSFLELFLL